MEILGIVWRLKAVTVRDVHDELLKTQSIAETAVRSQVEYMVEKGFLKVVDERRPQKFAATLTKDQVSEAFVAVARRLLGDSMDGFLVRLLKQRKLPSESDVRKTKALLDELE